MRYWLSTESFKFSMRMLISKVKGGKMHNKMAAIKLTNISSLKSCHFLIIFYILRVL